jgi:hypothetical protein
MCCLNVIRSCDEFGRMGEGKWTPSAGSTYNMVDAIYRSTVEVASICFDQHKLRINRFVI